MKKTISILFVALLAALTWSCSSDDDKDIPISADQLPANAKNFISMYFPQDKIVKVERDGSHPYADYDVRFQSGFEVEFNASGDWVDVDAPMGQTIPAGIAPGAIENYVSLNYPTSGINEISAEINGYEVELVNGLDLLFDLQGNFVGIGD
ncbi:MAG: PepSY-like domain-containing protein [Duncaniella sp.]|nr:PepSY-like domain-containing protein [Duncaniella sp.]MDE6859770.1 PepSY-like domain-containing protein [Duncaniella sp.]